MNVPTPTHTLPEWSYLIPEERAGVEITDLTISPAAEEAQALCQRLNLVTLDGLSAQMKIERLSGGMVVHVKGRLTAHVVQSCVVSLEPVETDIDETFEGWFANQDNTVILAKARRARQNADGEAPILEEKDDPEPIVNGHIDLGELATQYLSLALDPYPRAPGVGTGEEGDVAAYSDAPGADLRRNPFAALKDWKGGSKDGE